MTAAHDQAVTHHYTVHYPPHEPREGDRHYVDFTHYHRQTRAAARCYVGERIGYDECADTHGQGVVVDADGVMSGLELHHTHIEFALQNGVDLAALEVDYPGVSDPDAVGAWVESAANLRWLCVLPDTPVWMGDGSQRAIQDVVPGDQVVGHDGRPHLVTATSTSRYSGPVYRWGDCVVTERHRLLTLDGWAPATEVFGQLRVMGFQVGAMVGYEHQILDPVVRPVAVDVMNPLCGGEGPTQIPFHDEAVLHDQSGAVPDPHVTRSLYPRGSSALVPTSDFVEFTVQRPETTVIRAVHTTAASVCGAVPGMEHRPALQADNVGIPSEPTSTAFASNGCGVGGEHGTAVDAYPISKMSHRYLFYAGTVHDLSVEGAHSFVAGGVAVHNCAGHHRSVGGGVHAVAHADWEAEQYVKGLVSP